ncbi:MAG TPA: phenylalanine--tRNA ligase subunit beta [Burkholderiales bacterium]|nr:phenylalanine--tRNA ligase subunit beta [Burkholderiales bacterium]
MKFSENWLRTFVNPQLSTRELAEAIAMSGLDVEHVEPAAPAFTGVVAGEVTAVRPHPNADRLAVCEVNIGRGKLTIVCGAPNVAVGAKVPTALPGAKLPGLDIGRAEVRGVESQGMLCSARELGLSEEAGGLLMLPPHAVPGADVRSLLELDDQLITLKPTPNRGDCLSMTGIAREVAAVTGAPLLSPDLKPARVIGTDRLGVTLEAPQACPRYCGRLIRGINSKAASPDWMVRRLAGSGVRAISALVDITNYVMLELGQPLHAFDAGKLSGGVRVRFARPGERLVLLNGSEPALDPGFLVIADERRAIALGGVMGGLESSVSDATRDVFVESAFFAPDVIAGKSRLLGFASESAYRFERGVDFAGTAAALERATQLILEICGGTPGPVTEARATLPARDPVRLRLARAERLLGVRLDGTQVSEILRRLRFEFTAGGGEFRVTPPSFRFDIAIEEDLIEELARIYGYERIPATLPATRVAMLPVPESTRALSSIRAVLAVRDYQEIVSYSFVDESWERDLAGNLSPVALANPIASHMNVMRSTLAGGLIGCLSRNLSHQQARVRLFEMGRCFSVAEPGNYRQPVRVGGVAYGDAAPEQWGLASRQVDFFDVKGDIEALLAPRVAEFRAVDHPALHPGKSAEVVLGGRVAGWLGELHPRWQRKYDLPLPPILFELDYNVISERELPAYNELSRFPSVRRDISAEVDEGVSYGTLLAGLREKRPAIVTEISLFDIYRGSGVGKGRKSLAFRVLLQDTRKTLTEAEVESAVEALRQVLQQQFNAKLR